MNLDSNAHNCAESATIPSGQAAVVRTEVKAIFSVIVPTRNRPEMLEAAIASVLVQEGVAFELIVVDDGSGEGARLAAHIGNPAIVVLDNRKRGQVRARNLAVAHSLRPIIAFLDDDDRWCDRHHLARASTAFEAGADLWFSGGTLLEDDGGSLPYAVMADERTLERDNGILVSASCYRRSLHDRLGIFDETLQFYWDWDWYLRIARSGARLVHDPNRSVLIRRHTGNVTRPGFETPRALELQRFAAKHGLSALDLKTHADLVSPTNS